MLYLWLFSNFLPETTNGIAIQPACKVSFSIMVDFTVSLYTVEILLFYFIFEHLMESLMELLSLFIDVVTNCLVHILTCCQIFLKFLKFNFNDVKPMLMHVYYCNFVLNSSRLYFDLFFKQFEDFFKVICKLVLFHFHSILYWDAKFFQFTFNSIKCRIQLILNFNFYLRIFEIVRFYDLILFSCHFHKLVFLSYFIDRPLMFYAFNIFSVIVNLYFVFPQLFNMIIIYRILLIIYLRLDFKMFRHLFCQKCHLLL